MVAVKYLETDLTFSIKQKKASTAANAAKRASQLLGRMTGLDPGCFISESDEAEDGALGDWVDKHNCAPILYMTTSRGKGLLVKAQATSEVAVQAMQDHENNLSSQLKLKDEHVEKRLKKMQLEIEVLEREKKILTLKSKIKNREVEAGLKKNMEAGLLASESATLKLEKEKYQTLESSFKEMEAKEADCQKSKKELDDKLNFVMESVLSINARCTRLECANETLKKSVTSLENENATLKKSVTALENENATLKKSVTSLENENATLKKSVTALEHENGMLKGSVATLEGGVTALQHENAMLREGVTALQHENATLRGGVTALQHENATLRGSVTALEQGNATLNNTVASLQRTVTILQEDNQRFWTRLGQVAFPFNSMVMTVTFFSFPFSHFCQLGFL